MNKLVMALAVGATVGLAPLSASAVTATFAPVGSVQSGNDCTGTLGTSPECVYFSDTLGVNTPQIAKYDVEEDEWEFNPAFPSVDLSDFSLTFTTAASGTFTYTGDVGITAFTLKAGNAWRAFEITNNGTATDYNGVPWSTLTAGLVDGGGAGRELSHIVFFDSRANPPQFIPIPAAAWLLAAGLMGMGAIGRRRLSARV
jgi:hypothetical protein